MSAEDCGSDSENIAAPVEERVPGLEPKDIWSAELATFLRGFISELPPALVVEVRAFDIPQRYGAPRTVSGFFDLASLAHVIKMRDAVWGIMSGGAQPEGIYVTLNPVVPACLARANAVIKVPKKSISAGDKDVVCRRWMLVDVDPRRPVSGVSATDAEKAAAKDLADGVRDDLRVRGWAAPMVVDSGNGYHLYYRVDLPAADDRRVERCLKALAARHNTPAAAVDVTVFNPSRIVKIPGTWARKGDETPDRPHRKARVLEVPEL